MNVTSLESTIFLTSSLLLLYLYRKQHDSETMLNMSYKATVAALIDADRLQYSINTMSHFVLFSLIFVITMTKMSSFLLTDLYSM